MKLGAAIRELRIKRGLNQKELSKITGISETSMSLIETGKTRPKKNTLAKICQALEISEPLLYVLSITQEDVSPEKRSRYWVLFPVLRTIVKQLIKE